MSFLWDAKTPSRPLLVAFLVTIGASARAQTEPAPGTPPPAPPAAPGAAAPAPPPGYAPAPAAPPPPGNAPAPAYPPPPGAAPPPYAPPPPYYYAEPPPPPPEPEGPKKNETSGLAIGGGVGYQVAGVGVELVYYLALSSSVRLAPYVGTGFFPSELGTHYGYAGGLMFSFGQKHRGVLDVGYGLAAVEGQKNLITGEVVTSQTVYGVTVAAGYEYLADGGFFVRPTVGVTIFTTETSFIDKKTTPTLNIALGYKIF